MNKTFIFVAIFCTTFTCWWAWELDYGPFIYRHQVPEKLEIEISKTFYPYIKVREIDSIRLGKKNARSYDQVLVSVNSSDGGEVQEWLISNSETGPVKVDRDMDKNTLNIYWDMPEDMPFNASYELLSNSIWRVLEQYDQIIGVQETYRQ